MPDIPDKLYFRIGEVARLLDLPTHVLRFWESEFPQLKPNKGGTGQRLYRRRDVETALHIRKLLYDEGYTIPGARQLLKGEARAEAPRKQEAAPVAVPRAAQGENSGASSIRLRRLQTELRELQSLLERPAPGTTRRRTGTPPAAHRGLHISSRRRTQGDAPTLFSLDPPTES